MTTPAKIKKEFILLRFAVADDPNAYRVRSVPILERVTFSTLTGFAVHRAYRSWDALAPVPQLYRVSDIDTGTTIAEGSTIPSVINASQRRIESHGVEQTRIAREATRVKLDSMRKLT